MPRSLSKRPQTKKKSVSSTRRHLFAAFSACVVLCAVLILGYSLLTRAQAAPSGSDIYFDAATMVNGGVEIPIHNRGPAAFRGTLNFRFRWFGDNQYFLAPQEILVQAQYSIPVNSTSTFRSRDFPDIQRTIAAPPRDALFFSIFASLDPGQRDPQYGNNEAFMYTSYDFAVENVRAIKNRDNSMHVTGTVRNLSAIDPNVNFYPTLHYTWLGAGGVTLGDRPDRAPWVRAGQTGTFDSDLGQNVRDFVAFPPPGAMTLRVSVSIDPCAKPANAASLPSGPGDLNTIDNAVITGLPAGLRLLPDIAARGAWIKARGLTVNLWNDGNANSATDTEMEFKWLNAKGNPVNAAYHLTLHTPILAKGLLTLESRTYSQLHTFISAPPANAVKLQITADYRNRQTEIKENNNQETIYAPYDLAMTSASFSTEENGITSVHLFFQNLTHGSLTQGTDVIIHDKQIRFTWETDTRGDQERSKMITYFQGVETDEHTWINTHRLFNQELDTFLSSPPPNAKQLRVEISVNEALLRENGTRMDDGQMLIDLNPENDAIVIPLATTEKEAAIPEEDAPQLSQDEIDALRDAPLDEDLEAKFDEEIVEDTSDEPSCPDTDLGMLIKEQGGKNIYFVIGTHNQFVQLDSGDVRRSRFIKDDVLELTNTCFDAAKQGRSLPQN